MQLLVTNIQFNDGKPFKMQLPMEYYEYGPLSEPYVRTWIFNHIDLTFDYSKIQPHSSYTTESLAVRPYIIDLIDRDYPQYVTVEIVPLSKSATTVYLDPNEYHLYASDDHSQAVYEQLLFKLDIDFLITVVDDEPQN